MTKYTQGYKPASSRPQTPNLVDGIGWAAFGGVLAMTILGIIHMVIV